jgi:hypothetical protein
MLVKCFLLVREGVESAANKQAVKKDVLED